MSFVRLNRYPYGATAPVVLFVPEAVVASLGGAEPLPVCTELERFGEAATQGTIKLDSPSKFELVSNAIRALKLKVPLWVRFRQGSGLDLRILQGLRPFGLVPVGIDVLARHVSELDGIELSVLDRRRFAITVPDTLGKDRLCTVVFEPPANCKGLRLPNGSVLAAYGLIPLANQRLAATILVEAGVYEFV